ncbi:MULTISPECIES: integrase catalytic domain-containing protein [Rhodanobacter]|uniref:integrase catalytic domain-containing protein n=1 Tax=Rhodanobacter TaxID=75309 RepID=UPI0003FE255E|nr:MULTISPECIES: DDE-type integrase/transposase/recombinase [Rhodanobacter]TAN18782.1 MAG: transposase [Rhodanobacter sp.]UJJ55022.1 DDE-type integrase/transposase/recombinase [Rhodanobacter thiooxydans]
MNVDKLTRHLAGLRVSPAGIRYVVDSALAPPQIHLRSGPQHNLTGDISTTLCTYLDEGVDGDVVPRLQVASLSAEHAFFVNLQFRGDVVFAINHPLQVPLRITNRRGRHQRIAYTPDAIAIDDKRACVFELKTDNEADDLTRKRPHDWRKIDVGYEYTTAKHCFAEMGLRHVVVVSSSLPWIRTRNQQFLDRQSAPEPDPALDQRIVRYVKRNSPVALQQIILSCGVVTASPVLRLIKLGVLHVDLDHVLLSAPDSAVICASPDQAAAVSAGIASLQSVASTRATASIEQTGDPKHLDELGFRIGCLQGKAVARTSGRAPSRRTKQRWTKAFKEGGAVALNPKWSRCGNRDRRLACWHETLLFEFIKTERSSTEYPSRTDAMGEYERRLAKEAKKRCCDGSPVHYSTFCKLWARRDHCTEDAMARGGRRMANAVAPHGDVDKQIRLADGPFQVAHIDHCLAPTYSKDDTGAEAKPWLTILVDDWTGEPLARVMTHEKPSHKTDLALLRECVRKHGRLPHTILSDHGSDFMGTVFVAALAALGVDAIYRPEAHPRVGHRVERTFGTFAETVCRGYPGFAVDIPNSRAISAKKHPSRGPRRDFDDLLHHTDHFLFEVIPTLKPLDGGKSKREARQRFEETYGKQGITVVMNLEFLIVTSPPLKESGCIEPSGAIRVKEKRFYTEALIGVDLRQHNLSLRQEPEDPSILYYAFGGKWHVAKSRDALKSHGRTDESIRAEAQCLTRPTAADRAQRRRTLHSAPKSKRPHKPPPSVGQSMGESDTPASSKPTGPVDALPTLPLPLKI